MDDCLGTLPTKVLCPLDCVRKISQTTSLILLLPSITLLSVPRLREYPPLLPLHLQVLVERGLHHWQILLKYTVMLPRFLNSRVYIKLSLLKSGILRLS
jgi:hypothetical protein